MSGFIGPPLPPGLLPPVEYSGAEEPQAVSSEISPVSNNATAGPVLPPGYGSGPANKYQQEEVSFGPALPPSLPLDSPEEEEEEEMGNLEGRRVIGPALPIQMQLNQAKEIKEDEEDKEVLIGPLPPSNEETTISILKRNEEINRRSRRMKDELTDTGNKYEPIKREEWMIELPPERKAFGLGARKFRKTYIDPGDRSVWTDSPAQKKQLESAGVSTASASSQYTIEDQVMLKRDVKLREQVNAYNKSKRSETLVDLHKRKRASEASGIKERQPFDRERDLALPGSIVTSSKRQALMKDSAKSLQNKFTHGKQSFL